MSRLCMYDVRGIQNYIFKTNKMKEIIGASKIVENLIIEAFKKACNECGIQPITTVESNKPLLDSYEAQVIYYGGGNLLVLYASEELAKKVSRKMCIKVSQETYSLQLAVASVEVTNNYKEDYSNLRLEMEKVKANMPMSTPMNGLPFTLSDPQTGLPLSKIYDGKMVSYESFKKLSMNDTITYSDNGSLVINEFKEEDNSMVAFVHIDGNGMGAMIKDKMAKVKTYKEGTKLSREISEDIQKVFIDGALKYLEDHLQEIVEAKGIKSKGVYRRVINAGDDITFICKAEIALECVKTFMSKLENTQYTACAGVYIAHSHFPFARAYEYAEQLCSNAKVLSRKNDGNYIDFQVNYSGILNDLDVVRDRAYTNIDGEPMYARPYYIGVGKGKDINELINTINDVNKKGTVARGKMKELRESFYEGEAMIEKELNRIYSRFDDDDNVDFGDKKVLFDAIDIMDLKWGDDHGKA